MIKKNLLSAVIVLLLFSFHTSTFAAGGAQADPITIILNGSQMGDPAYDV